MEACSDYIKMYRRTHDMAQHSFDKSQQRTQSDLIEFFHIITLTKVANWDKSTKFPVDHRFLYLPGTKIISKEKT